MRLNALKSFFRNRKNRRDLIDYFQAVLVIVACMAMARILLDLILAWFHRF